MSLRKRSSVSKVQDNFERFDAFTKPKEEIQLSTKATQSTSIILSCFLALVLIAEIYTYSHSHQIQDFTVDSEISVKNDLKINLDIILGMPCDDIAIDILDESDTLYRANSAFVKDSHDFLLDYEQGVEHHEYKKAPSRRDGKNEKILGCRVHGKIDLPKLNGNLHLTPSGHLHSGKHASHDTMNLTHVINNLSFGSHYSGLVNPLNGVKKVAHSHFWNYRYFIHIVPTSYINAWGTKLQTFQYSVSEYDMEVSEENRRSPGIFFKYNIAEFHNTVRDHSKGFAGFLLRLCAIIGGVFSSTKLIFAVSSMLTTLKAKSSSSKMD